MPNFIPELKTPAIATKGGQPRVLPARSDYAVTARACTIPIQRIKTISDLSPPLAVKEPLAPSF